MLCENFISAAGEGGGSGLAAVSLAAGKDVLTRVKEVADGTGSVSSSMSVSPVRQVWVVVVARVSGLVAGSVIWGDRQGQTGADKRRRGGG